MEATLFNPPAATPPEIKINRVVLRPYQQRAIAAARKALATDRSTLIVSPTGSGKTILFAAIAGMTVARMGRTIIFVDQRELVDQTVEKLRLVCGDDLRIGVEMADHVSHPDDQVIVAMRQSMATNGRFKRFDPFAFAVIVIDESDRALCNQYHKVIVPHFQQNSRLKLIGVTATPDRGDKRALSQIFDSCCFQYELPDAIADGYLCRLIEYPVDVGGIDISKLKANKNGDFSDKAIEEAYRGAKAAIACARPIFEFAEREGIRKTIVFACSVDHAIAMADVLNGLEPGCAAAVHCRLGDTERERIVAEFRSGTIRYATNFNVLSRGFDVPDVAAVALCRPTKIRSLVAQFIGRATRTWPGCIDGLNTPAERLKAIAASPKPYAYIINLVPHAGKHKLVSPADVLGGKLDEDVLDAAKKIIKKAATRGEAVDIDEAMRDAAAQVAKNREREAKRLVAHIAKNVEVNWSAMARDPFDALGIRPRQPRGWENDRMIPPHVLNKLQRHDINTEGMHYTHAMQLYMRMVKQPDRTPATKPQVATLRKNAHHLPPGTSLDGLTVARASQLLDGIAKKLGWAKRR